MFKSEQEAWLAAFKTIFDTLGDRLRGHDKEIEELKAEVALLKQEPRTSLAQRMRTRGA